MRLCSDKSSKYSFKNELTPQRGDDFRSDWGRFAFAQLKHLLLLPLCFRTDKTFVVAAATLSHRAKLPGGVR